MRRTRRYVALGCVAVFALCLMVSGGDAPVAVAQDTLAARDPRVPPRKRKKLFAWLEARKYESYAAEPEVHASLGPHGGNVRTYYNSILVDDLRAGRSVWSKGAAMVKELYFGGTEEVRGYAVMIKTKAETGATGDGWITYETFNLENGTGYYGLGLGLCVNCHQTGTDLLLSEFRPE